MPQKVSRPKTAASKAGLPMRGELPREPVHYSKAKGLELCERLARGERWSRIAGTPGMPSLTMPYAWAKKYPGFRDTFAEAKRIGADSRADRVLDVAETTTSETLSVDRAHISALKWHVERDDKVAAKRDEPDLGAGRKLIIVVRQFERYVAEDGTTKVREIPGTGAQAKR